MGALAPTSWHVFRTVSKTDLPASTPGFGYCAGAFLGGVIGLPEFSKNKLLNRVSISRGKV